MSDKPIPDVEVFRKFFAALAACEFYKREVRCLLYGTDDEGVIAKEGIQLQVIDPSVKVVNLLRPDGP
jgi:hypothetical protein